MPKAREAASPCRGWLIIVVIATPGPLKLVLDDALGHHKLPDWLAWAHDYGFGHHTLGGALFAGIATLFIARPNLKNTAQRERRSSPSVLIERSTASNRGPATTMRIGRGPQTFGRGR
jgi:hypothetical protein